MESRRSTSCFIWRQHGEIGARTPAPSPPSRGVECWLGRSGRANRKYACPPGAAISGPSRPSTALAPEPPFVAVDRVAWELRIGAYYRTSAAPRIEFRLYEASGAA